MSTQDDTPDLERLNRDIRMATATLERREARYLVDTYYQMQDYRISTSNQGRSMGRDAEPHLTLDFFQSQMKTLERQVHSVLDTWTTMDPLGTWAKSITGIGPVIAAGLLAHIDIEKAPTVGHIWRYAGLDPTVEWGKGEKRPWNASLKVICWKAGESFVKVSNNQNDIYGKFYVQRKEYEIERNEAVYEVGSGLVKGAMSDPNKGAYIIRDDEMVSAYLIEGKWYCGGNAKAAYGVLRRKKIGKDTDAIKSYSVGKLPPAHIHARAKRWATKLFLAHYWETGYRLHFGTEPPLPYPIQHLNHVHRIPAPNPIGG
jgi:Transposase IS116/IS110/IS902 family